MCSHNSSTEFTKHLMQCHACEVTTLQQQSLFHSFASSVFWIYTVDRVRNTDWQRSLFINKYDFFNYKCRFSTLISLYHCVPGFSNSNFFIQQAINSFLTWIWRKTEPEKAPFWSFVSLFTKYLFESWNNVAYK